MIDEDGYTTLQWRVLETCEQYRLVQTECGAYEVHRRCRQVWYHVGTSTSFEDVARRKMSRLLGHRDTETSIGEWMTYYGVGCRTLDRV